MRLIAIFSVTLTLSCTKPDRSEYAKRFDHEVVYEGMRNKLVYYDRQLKPQREVRLGLMLWNFATPTDSLTLAELNFMENYQSPEIKN